MARSSGVHSGHLAQAIAPVPDGIAQMTAPSPKLASVTVRWTTAKGASAIIQAGPHRPEGGTAARDPLVWRTEGFDGHSRQ